MKIKAVTEATGLTDRAIRFYIEAGLLAPDCTENFRGRKSYDFSDADVETLKEIAVFRKFGFSVAEIEQMLNDHGMIPGTVCALRERKQAEAEKEAGLLRVLDNMPREATQSPQTLCRFLETPVTDSPVPAGDNAGNRRFSLGTLALNLILCLPAVAACLAAITTLPSYAYPIINDRAILSGIVLLLPTWIGLGMGFIRKKRSYVKVIRIMLAGLCLLSLPLTWVLGLCTVEASETSAVWYYRQVDARSLAATDPLFHNLFPQHLPLGEGNKYYYRNEENFFGFKTTVYAERSLTPEDLESERQRVEAALKTWEPVYSQEGSYMYLVAGDAQNVMERPEGLYTVAIFAWNPDTGRVRYIYCASTVRDARPWYLDLEWETQ